MTSHRFGGRPAALAAVLAALVLSGCVGLREAPRQTLGAAGGAALGGFLGSQIGSGAGQLAATAGLAIAGGLIGNDVGRQLDRVDRFAAREASSRALAGPVKKPVYWRNPHSGHHGSVAAGAVFKRKNGQICRQLEQTVVIAGEEEAVLTTVCQDGRGAWVPVTS